jgi:hypothetical protein
MTLNPIWRGACSGAFVLSLAGCAAGDSSGTDHVDELPRLSAAEELRIGSLDDPDMGFTRIGAVAVDRDANVYVIEPAEREIRVYDPQGLLIRRIGRQGSGPGEFETPTAFGIIGDTLWTNDIRNRRITLFTRDGALITSFTTTPIPIETIPGMSVMLTANGLAKDGTLTSGWMVAIRPDSDPLTDTIMIPVVRMDTTGAILDTVRYLPWAFPQRGTIMAGSREIPLPSTPSAGPLEHAGPDGSVFAVERPFAGNAQEGVFTVTRIDPAGDTVYRLPYRYRPRVYDDTVVSGIIRPHAATYAERTGTDADVLEAQLRQALVLPPFQPGIAAVKAGQDGSLWLRTADDGASLAHWIILNPDGSARGVVDLPRGATLHWMDGDVSWAAVPDDVDVPWLVRYRVTPME